MSEDSYHCDDCGATTNDRSELDSIYNFYSRVGPGELVPFGQCPHCGGLVHKTDLLATSNKAEGASMSTPEYKCECGSTDIIHEATIWLKSNDEDSKPSTDDIEYDRKSTAQCLGCGANDQLRCFENDEYEGDNT